MDNQAAVLQDVGRIELAEVPVPEPGPREVLIEVTAVGICGSDVHYYEHGRIGGFVVRAPLVLGHETAGRIVGVGTDVPDDRVGQRVALEPGVPCGDCKHCRAGRYNLCPDVVFHATPPVDGTLTRYVTLHADFAHPIPDELSDEDGAMIEPLSVGVYACWKADVSVGSRVLVTGAGPVGLLAAQVALASGAAEVVVTDVNPTRLELARQLGATAVDVREQPLAEQDLTVDVHLECSGAPGALADGLRALEPAGISVAIGMNPDDEISLPIAAIQAKELRLTGTFRYANTYPAAIALAASGRIQLAPLVSHRFSLAEAEQALTIARRDPSAVKPMVLPGS